MCNEAKKCGYEAPCASNNVKTRNKIFSEGYPFYVTLRLTESVDNSGVSGLSLVLSVEEKAVLLLAPRVLVRDTPDSNTDTLRNVKASLGNGSVVGSRGRADVELSDGNLLYTSGSHLLESSLDTVGGTGVEMGLRTDTVNGDALGDPLLDVSDHTSLELGGVGVVNAVIVDVQLGVGVSSAGSAEGNANELLTQNLSEGRVLAEGTIPVEDLVEDILLPLVQIRDPKRLE